MDLPCSFSCVLINCGYLTHPLLAPGYLQDPERLTPQEREATWEQARFMAGWNRKLNTNKVGVVPGYM
jgi:hypothetical protein